MIKDDNTLEDIQGAIYCLQSDVHKDVPEFSVGAQFTELIERIEDRLARTQNSVRKNWFTLALDHARAAQQQFSDLHCDEADMSLTQCLDSMTDGNKAHRRKANFIVAPDGTTSGAQYQPTENKSP